MKRKIDFLIVALFAVVLFASCERVAPNYAGVLMENYGKQGKEDFKEEIQYCLNLHKQKPIWKHLIVILIQKSKRINLLFLR